MAGGATTGSSVAMLGLFVCFASAPKLAQEFIPLTLMVGASVGAIGGLAGGGIAYAKGGGEWFAIDIALEGGIAWSASLGVGSVATRILFPSLEVPVTTLIGPGLIFIHKLGYICSEIFASRITLVSAAFRRFPIGRLIGIAIAITTLIIWLVIVINQSPEATKVSNIDLILFYSLIFIGASAGLVGALGSTMHGASRRHAAFFAIEASGISVGAALAGVALTSLVAPLLGIGFATGIAALWSATRGRHIHPRQQ